MELLYTPMLCILVLCLSQGITDSTSSSLSQHHAKAFSVAKCCFPVRIHILCLAMCLQSLLWNIYGKDPQAEPQSRWVLLNTSAVIALVSYLGWLLHWLTL